jgi:hypothetical protein
MRACEVFAGAVMMYRQKLPPSSACWMDEWALGYFCALRDAALINKKQWEFLCDTFQPDE